MNRGIPRIASLYQHPTNADYVIIRPLVTIGGVALRNGDHLPVDSPIRQSARRLELLCRQRVLAPQLGTAKPAQAPNVVAPVAEETPMTNVDYAPEEVVPEVGYSTMTVQELQEECRRLNIKAHGNRIMLRNRLTQYAAAA